MVRVVRSAGCSVHPSPNGADGSKTRAPLLWYCSTTGSEKPSVSTVVPDAPPGPSDGCGVAVGAGVDGRDGRFLAAGGAAVPQQPSSPKYTTIIIIMQEIMLHNIKKRREGRFL